MKRNNKKSREKRTKKGKEKRSSTHKKRRSRSRPPPAAPAVSVESIKDVQPAFHNMLYEEANPIIRVIFERIEATLHCKREYVAYGSLGLLALYFVFGRLAHLFCNMLGFAYPAYKSVLAIRTEGKDDDTEWLTYWVVFAFFSCVDCLADAIMSWFPIYWLVKAIFIMYLVTPQTRGALRLYVNYVDPWVTMMENLYDEKFGQNSADSASITAKPPLPQNTNPKKK